MSYIYPDTIVCADELGACATIFCPADTPTDLPLWNINFLPCPLLAGNATASGSSFEVSQFDYATRHRAKYIGNYMVNASFVTENDTQMRYFKDFYFDTLADGVSKFNAEWKIEGFEDFKVFRFASMYSVKHLGIGKYKISANFEMITKIKDL